MYILGISAFYHDSAACLIKDGKILSAIQEERFSRKKNDSSFPKKVISYFLKNYKISLNEINYIVFYEKPFLKFERLIETYVKNSPRGFGSFIKSIPYWVKEKLFQKKLILDNLLEIDSMFNKKKCNLLFSNHHLSHAASCYYPSPFEDAAILTLDGVGEWTTTAIFLGEKNKITLKEKIDFPNSLGLLYSSFTQYLGFKVNEDEYKIMGLAPYGEPIYKDKIMSEIVEVHENGFFKLNMKYFNYESGLTMINKKFEDFFGKKTRKKNAPIENFHKDLAASIQKTLEEIIIKIAKYIKLKYQKNKLCLAGGVALNCVINGKLQDKKIFKDIWVQPAAGDAGGSLGAALLIWHQKLNNSKNILHQDSMQNSLLGRSYNTSQVEAELNKLKSNFETFEDDKLIDIISSNLIKGKTIGWFQGREEFGPRALGSRSIIADPRNPNMQKILNLKIKFRESFRPFAPAVLEDESHKWFKMDYKSPFMLFVADLKDDKKINLDEKNNKNLNELRSEISSVTHVDYSARVQTVNETNGKFYKLIKNFYKKTGCPMVINTSFNINREPIVGTIEEAYKTFLSSGLDILVCENSILYKENQYEKFN
jgi:carbamoyltransferase